MSDQADNLVGVPEPNPPAGGAKDNPDVPDPADLVPGLGGTSGTKPDSGPDSGPELRPDTEQEPRGSDR